MSKHLLSIAITLGLLQAAHAASRLPVSDSFPYSVGNLGTVGSSGNWSGSTTANTIVAGSLNGTNLGLVASSGNMIGMTSSSSSTYNLFASASGDITNGKVYASFLLRVNDVSSVSTSGESPISLNAQNSSSFRYVELWCKNVSGSVQLGLAKNGGTPVYVTSGSGSSVADGNTYLVVLSQEFSAATNNDDIVKLWVNPASLNGATEDPNPKATINTGNDVPSSAGIGRFYLNGGTVCNIDELRLGTTWKDVTPSSASAAVPVKVPRVTQHAMAPQGMVLRGTNGTANAEYKVLAYPDLTVPRSQWPVVGTGNFDSNGNFACTNPITSGAPAQFYCLMVTAGGPPTSGAPVITTQPQSQEGALGQAATFSVVAGGAAPLSYRWYFHTNAPLANATNSSFTIPSVGSNDLGGYSVVVTNSLGSVTSAVAMLTLIVPPTNGDYYISPTGNDANPGTVGQPFLTLPKAVSVAAPGNVIYLRGGTYYYSQTIQITNSGTAAAPIQLVAFPGEHPVFNFSNQPYGSANRGILITTNANYWQFKGLEVCYAGDNGIKVEGSHLRFEQCLLHHNGDTGLQIGFGHTDKNPGGLLAAFIDVINCDSYLNYDPDSHGGDADGFAAKMHCGQGIVFQGCRAWQNSDDGWDLFETDYSVVISNCWAWKSGVDQGNGNGIKMGGDGAGGDSMGTHCAYNCVTFGCKVNGFTQNSHKDGEVVVNCLSFSNGASGYNFFFEGSLNSGKQNVFKNNVSVPRSGTNTGGFSEDNNPLQLNNTWNLAVSANSADYGDLTEAAAGAPRNPDGSLPTGFARLVSGSDLIDQGIDVSLPHCGAAPDLGPYELCP